MGATKLGTHLCTADIDSVRDMALVNMSKVWRFGSDDYCMNDMGWKFKFNDRKRALGLCSPRNRTIYLSSWFLDNANREMSGWENTMIHEIAHAINHHLGGRGHDRQWRNIFLSMGGSGTRCSKDAITYNDDLVKNPISKYTNICANGHKRPAHKRSRTITQGRQACGQCCNEFNGGKFSKKYLLAQIQNY